MREAAGWAALFAKGYLDGIAFSNLGFDVILTYYDLDEFLKKAAKKGLDVNTVLETVIRTLSIAKNLKHWKQIKGPNTRIFIKITNEGKEEIYGVTKYFVPGMENGRNPNPTIRTLASENKVLINEIVRKRMEMLGIDKELIGIKGYPALFGDEPFVLYHQVQGGGNLRRDHKLVLDGRSAAGINIDDAFLDHSFKLLEKDSRVKTSMQQINFMRLGQMPVI